MKKLLDQIVKFGIVGVICFFIDYLIGLVSMKVLLGAMGDGFFSTASTIGSILGFIVSVIANYILSFMFVFKRKEDMDRKKEFVIFLVLSVIGLLINALIIWIFTGPVYNSLLWIQAFGYSLVYTGAKIIATAIVMVYNFITRKIFLEDHSKAEEA